MKVTYLEATHIPWVSGILEAVLVALEEKLQLEPATGLEMLIGRMSNSSNND